MARLNKKSQKRFRPQVWIRRNKSIATKTDRSNGKLRKKQKREMWKLNKRHTNRSLCEQGQPEAIWLCMKGLSAKCITGAREGSVKGSCQWKGVFVAINCVFQAWVAREGNMIQQRKPCTCRTRFNQMQISQYASEVYLFCFVSCVKSGVTYFAVFVCAQTYPIYSHYWLKKISFVRCNGVRRRSRVCSIKAFSMHVV